MAKKLDPMDLKQILSLHLDGFSNRQISATLGIGRNTINGYMQQFTASDVAFRELIELDEPSFQELFPSKTTIINRRHATCKRITEAGAANYGMVKNILEKRLDQLPGQASLDFTTPSHENLRGANHYS